MKRAARSGDNDDGDSTTDLVTRCSNTDRNVFNEASCKISYHQDACVSSPLPDPNDSYRATMVSLFPATRKIFLYHISLLIFILTSTILGLAISYTAQINPGTGEAEPVWKYSPDFAGPDNGGVGKTLLHLIPLVA